jgi:outer membrane lipoprotein
MKAYLLFFCFILTACTNLPTAILNAPTFDLSFPQASQAINQYKNSPVRWGGLIINVENEKNAGFIQVLSYPLARGGRPRLEQPAQGRFVIQLKDYLEASVYTRDTLLTVAGSLIGSIERVIDKKVMRIPVISASVIYLWPVYQYNNDISYGDYDEYRYYGYNPYYGGGVYPYMYYGY